MHPDGWQTPVYPDSEEKETFETSELILPNNTPEQQTDKLELQSDTGEETIGILPINDATTSSNSTGPDSIILNLKKDSWVEIYDATDKRIFMNLAKEGEHYKINGTAPFNVTLGFSEGVHLEFNGKPFDQTPYSNNGVARFKLPPE